MRKLAFLIYAWGSTILMGLFIYWLATIPYLSAGDRVTDELVKIIFRMTLYSIFFILFYRSLIITLKTSVERLAKWRSKNEKMEDEEFVLIIETLSVIITILATVLFSVLEQYAQYLAVVNNAIANRSPELKDVLVSILSILLTSIVVYSIPAIGELEIGIKHRLEQNRKK